MKILTDRQREKKKNSKLCQVFVSGTPRNKGTRSVANRESERVSKTTDKEAKTRFNLLLTQDRKISWKLGRDLRGTCVN